MTPNSGDGSGPLDYFAERVRSVPALELLAATREAVSFRYRCDDPQTVNPHLADALRASGFEAARTSDVGGRRAIRVERADCAQLSDADALLAAAITLGAVAANGRPVPPAVTACLSSDGLPMYIGFAGLWRLELGGMEIARLGPMLDARVARNPEDAAAMMDIATLLFLTLLPANRAIAFATQARALELQQIFRLPAWRDGKPLRVLVLASPGDMTANTHLDCLVEDSDVELLILYVREGRPLPSPPPDHDVVFVAIGEAAANRPLLEQVAPFVSASPKPVLNRPERILPLSRDRVAALLQSLPGVAMPATERVRREILDRVARGTVHLPQGGSFPILVRPLDSQGGKGLSKLDDGNALARYLGNVEEAEFFVSPFVDYSGADGLFRKYRVVVIRGRAIACHMAISDNWMIHYINADMDASAGKRAEEARFMEKFEIEFGARHAEALARIDGKLGLDYYGIDCGEARDGRLLVFEVDTAMLVHAMDPADVYPYKRPQMLKLFGAFQEMLKAAAR